MRKKSVEKYEKRIQELTSQCQRKTDECYQAWMSLTAANEQVEKVRMELDNKLFHTSSLGKFVKSNISLIFGQREYFLCFNYVSYNFLNFHD